MQMYGFPQISAMENLDDRELQHIFMLANNLGLEKEFIELIRTILVKRKLL